MKQHGKIILASASPRRKSLLESLGLVLEVMPSDVPETGVDGLPHRVVHSIANQKVQAVRERLGPSFQGWVLGADTVVVLEDEIFGKPQTPSEAVTMLSRLSGKTHHVLTAYRIEKDNGEFIEHVVESQVTFKSLKLQALESYVATGEPMDKAGAYAIQGGAADFVEGLVGSKTNVIGLPMEEVIQALLDLGAISL